MKYGIKHEAVPRKGYGDVVVSVAAEETLQSELRRWNRYGETSARDRRIAGSIVVRRTEKLKFATKGDGVPKSAGIVQRSRWRAVRTPTPRWMKFAKQRLIDEYNEDVQWCANV